MSVGETIHFHPDLEILGLKVLLSPRERREGDRREQILLSLF